MKIFIVGYTKNKPSTVNGFTWHYDQDSALNDLNTLFKKPEYVLWYRSHEVPDNIKGYELSNMIAELRNIFGIDGIWPQEFADIR